MRSEDRAYPTYRPGRSICSEFLQNGGPSVSWADFAREIFSKSGISCQVNDIPSAQYPTPAKRPQNSRLDCAGLKDDYGIGQPDWRLDLDEILRELA